MMRRDLPSDPLLWLRESAEPSPPDGVEARLAARLSSLSARTALGAATGSASPPSPPPPAALSSDGRFKLLADRFVRWSLVPLGLGAGLGAVAHAVWTGEQPRQSIAQVMPAVPSISSAAAGNAAAIPSSEPSADPSPVTVAPVPSIAKSTLPAERDLLDRARRQLASDEPARALAFLEQHAQRFQRGHLSEEREAMWINVLALLGRPDEAKARGGLFEARFPRSLMGPSVRAAVRAAEDSK